MKKLRIIMRVVGVLLVGTMLYSCSARNNEEISYDKLNTGWEKTMYNAMHFVESKSLSLEDYVYLGDVQSKEAKQELLDEIFGEKEYMVVLNSDYTEYDIMTYGECINLSNANNKKDLYAPRKRNVASAIVDRNIGVVELSWNYRGDRFKSKAIVATNGDENFIYDNIMTYAPADNDKKEIVRNETRSSQNDREEKHFSESGHGAMGFDGEYDWQYLITVDTYFNEEGIMVDRKLSRFAHAVEGWDCEADVMTVSGTLFKDHYHEFMWGYAYGDNIDVSVTPGGIGLIISGGGTSAAATAVHNSSKF